MPAPEPLEGRGHGWRVDRFGSDRVHVEPVADLVAHERVDGCVCGPRLEHYERAALVVHASLDGRELVEAA